MALRAHYLTEDAGEIPSTWNQVDNGLTGLHLREGDKFRRVPSCIRLAALATRGITQGGSHIGGNSGKRLRAQAEQDGSHEQSVDSFHISLVRYRTLRILAHAGHDFTLIPGGYWAGRSQDAGD